MTRNNKSINISRENVLGNCDLKCSYNFKYPQTNLTAKNDGVMISLTCDKNNTSPVSYNNQKYSVDKFIIVAPSIHSFNGSKTSAEILINHNPDGGGDQFIVCIPIIESTDSSSDSNLLTEIIQGFSNGAPVQGETTNLNINNFSLSTIVPKKPFYSYTSSSKQEQNEYIVFDILDAITLNNKTLSTLTSIIKNFSVPTPGKNLYYNEKGPNQSKVGDGIYISCQPTGSSTEETAVEYTKNSSTYDLFSFDKNTIKIILQVLFSCAIFIVVFGGIGFAYSKLSGNPIQLPNLGKFKTA
jgi:carbonic anhydrase